jgi:hypothetical protein
VRGTRFGRGADVGNEIIQYLAAKKEKATHCTEPEMAAAACSFPKAMFELDWPGHLPANDCVIANIFYLADHSLLLEEVNHNMDSGRPHRAV